MNLIEKDQIEATIGKASFWNPKQLVGACDYVGGIPDMDALIDPSSFINAPPLVTFKVYDQGLEIKLIKGFKSYYAAIPASALSSIILEVGGTIDVEERSVLGRAVLGGLLLGPLGAVVGGISGLKDNVIKDNDMLSVTTTEDGSQQSLLLMIKKGKTNEVKQFFSTYYAAMFAVNR